MPLDVRNLSPTELIRLVNSTPMGVVLGAPKLNRQMNEAGLRIGDGKRIHLVKYVAWLARQREQPKALTLTYDEKLRRDLERQLAISRQGRDIGPVPAVADPDRKARCQASFRLFCETYFPMAFNLRWSEDHLKVIAKIESAVIHGGLFAFAMPRGSGKTSLARVASLWAILYGYRAYVCLIGSAEDRAKMMLDSIKRELLCNEELLGDFPEVVFPIRKSVCEKPQYEPRP